MEEAERALVAARAREAKLLHVVEASRVGVNMAIEQAQITSACILSLEEERHRKVVLSKEEIRAKARECLHQDKAKMEKVLGD